MKKRPMTTEEVREYVAVTSKEQRREDILSCTKKEPFCLPEQFRQPNLLFLIFHELNKKHLHDNLEKIGAFCITITGYLPNPADRKSIAFYGDTATGKDNLIKTIFSHLPEEDVIFLTNATQSVLEEEIGKYKIIAYSEFNKERENGANAHLVEILKQITEGGTHSLKKDIKTGFKTTLDIVQEQKSVLYGTTDIGNDEEMGTRFIEITIKSYANKFKDVNINTLKNAGDIKKLINFSENESWIKRGIEYLKQFGHEIILPYADVLIKLLVEKNLFDYQEARSQRDIKRLIAVTKAISWLYQEQRHKINYCGETLIVSEPCDFVNAIILTGQFFNQTYKGFDSRLQAILDYMEKQTNGDYSIPIARSDTQKAFNKSRNTIKSYFKKLQDKQLIVYDRKEGNEVYYRRCQIGCQKGLIGINLEELKQELLTFNTLEGVKLLTPSDMLLTPQINPENYYFEVLGAITPENKEGVKKDKVCCDEQVTKENTALPEKFDTLNLTPSKNTALEVKEVTLTILNKPRKEEDLISELQTRFKNNPVSDFEKLICMLKFAGYILEHPAGVLRLAK